MTRTIELQALFDKSHMSLSLQGEILRFLFDSRELLLENGEKIFYVGKLSLGENLTLKGKKKNTKLTNVAVTMFWK